MIRMILLLLSFAAPALAAGPVVLAPAPGTPADTAARAALAQDLAEARRAGEKPLVLIGQAQLGRPTDRAALFVQLQSARECGSAGCSTSVLAWSPQGWRRVLDGVIGTVSVGKTRHNGWADLVAGRETYVWTGQLYRNVRPVPDIRVPNLRIPR